MDILCSNVCLTVLTDYFVLYQATIRAGIMHLFAYSVNQQLLFIHWDEGRNLSSLLVDGHNAQRIQQE